MGEGSEQLLTCLNSLELSVTNLIYMLAQFEFYYTMCNPCKHWKKKGKCDEYNVTSEKQVIL